MWVGLLANPLRKSSPTTSSSSAISGLSSPVGFHSPIISQVATPTDHLSPPSPLHKHSGSRKGRTVLQLFSSTRAEQVQCQVLQMISI
ncbi:unnamed protein product [Linum tenue]|uniref:Uncharacterized protein n=1 Tax=Linum tenue TaxID=586396 RepID=A0AAV0I4W1_9ROSI|nr:unnamed protein product [Linum tenue]